MADLIVEDGTGLVNADSYISLEDARIYATNYGYSLPDDDDEANIALRQGAVYVDNFESTFSGQRLNSTQSLAWPRINAYRCYGRDQIYIPSDTIPAEVKQAQVIAAETYASGVAVRANDDGKNIASEEVVGAVKVGYFDNGKTGTSIEITASIDALSPVMCNGSAFTMRTLRV